MHPSVTKLTLPALVLGVAAAGCGEEDSSAEGCRMPFTEYSAGSSVAGIEFETREPNCGKRPSVTYIYGTCEATSDLGCSTPVQVQSWSIRHRKPSRAPAGHDIEVRRGDVTIVIFARSDRLAAAAEHALRPAGR
jgi:hypothetical protein